MTSQIYDCASSNKSYENIFKKTLIYSAFKCKNCRKSYKNDFRRYLKNNIKWFYMNYIGKYLIRKIFDLWMVYVHSELTMKVWTQNPTNNLYLRHQALLYYLLCFFLIDWLVLNTNFSSIHISSIFFLIYR